MNYVITSMDGRGAASRGWESDSVCIAEGNVNDEKEALYIACLLRMIRSVDYLDGEYDSEDIDRLEKDYLDEWYGDDETDPEYIECKKWLQEEVRKDPLKWLNESNLDGIDGGDPWITKVKVNRKVLFKEDESWD